MACPVAPASRRPAGTQALIQLLPYLAAPGPVAIVGPTYSEHALAWRNAGASVISIENLDACPDSAIHAVVVNPNNPDGRVTDCAALTRIATRTRKAAADGLSSMKHFPMSIRPSARSHCAPIGR
jgi:histidinol-phosphate/aromatic aminotransferase/cobyric acid decarboxylase-like protein